MANGAPDPRKKRSPRPQDLGQTLGVHDFDADARTEKREGTPVKAGGLTFTRRKKDWSVSRAMRQVMRAQEKHVALGQRLRARLAELEVEQIEEAALGHDDREAELETQIESLIARADNATQEAELVSYRLLALLLVPPVAPPADKLDDFDDDAPEHLLVDEGFQEAFGVVEDPELAEPAIAFFQPAFDVEDAAALAEELTGSREPDPQTIPSSETGSG